MAAELPIHLDADTLGRLEIATWRTDAGDLDILVRFPSRDGTRIAFDKLVDRALVLTVHGIDVQVA